MIIIKNLKIFAYHGVKPEEKINGQNFLIDAKIKTKKLLGYKTDEISDVLSYSAVVKAIIKCFTCKSFNLIEASAETLANHLIKKYESIEKINITVKKPEAPIVGIDFDYVAVEISRERDDYIG